MPPEAATKTTTHWSTQSWKSYKRLNLSYTSNFIKERLFLEGEEDGENDEEEADEVVPLDGLAFENEGDDEGEDDEGDAFLDDLELHEREGAAGDLGTYAVGGDHETVLEQGHAPREEDDGNEGPVGDELHLLKLEVAVPRKCHEDIGAYEHHYGEECFGHVLSAFDFFS